MAFKGQNQRGVCQRERMKGGCKVREVKKGWVAGDGIEGAGVLAGFMRVWRDWEWERWCFLTRCGDGQNA